jgi:hypothetical protein
MQRGERQPPAELDHLSTLSKLLERAFRIPGTSWRFGLDALIGLVPGLGDVVGALLGIYSLWVARQIGAPGIVQARMVLNLALDGIIGLVPILGDVFDFVFMAHSRNQLLLEQWLNSPHTTRRSSLLVVGGCVLLLLALLGGAIWMLINTVQWLVTLF